MRLLFLLSTVEEYMLPCLNKKLLGFECFGCGLQRSVLLLVHGEFLAALKMYPAVYTLVPLFAIIGMNMFFKLKYADKIIRTLAIISIGIIIINFTYKLIN